MITWSWLAGFMDGEGSFFVAKTNTGKERSSDGLGWTSYRPRVTVVNTHLSTMEAIYRFLLPLDAYIVYKTRSQAPPKREKTELQIVSWGGCATICSVLIPHLVTKKEQAITLNKLCLDRLSAQDVDGKYGAAFTDANIELYNRLRELNTRGC